MGEQSEPGIFFARTTHFSKYTHFSHPEVVHSMLTTAVFLIMHSVYQTVNCTVCM